MKRLYHLCLTVALAATVAFLPLQAQTTGYFLHTVGKGQSLYSIAHMYNVSIDDIVRLNPGSDAQIRAGQALKIPQDTAQNAAQRFHTIQAGETLYQLTVKYNVSAQAICNANPGLSASNFRIGQVVVIPSDTTAAGAPAEQPAAAAAGEGAATATTTDQQKGWRTMHKVEKKETVFSISREYGISQEELIAANPELRSGKLKKGSFLFIPYAKSEQPKAAPAPIAPPSNEELFSQSRTDTKVWDKHLKAALLLPFTGENGVRDEEQTRMLEFYEGFLMAVDSLKHQGVSMDIYTYDTKGSEQTVKQLLAGQQLKGMDVIFSPNHTATTQLLAEFARQHQIRLVVPFSNKVDQVFTNPQVYQINTPQSYLYSEVYEHFIRKFRKANVVFLSDGASKEKEEFVKGMKDELKANGIRFRQIQVSGEVDGVQVIAAMDTLNQNVFIPTSGSNTALIRLLPHLTLVRREHPHFDMQLFGYPEWQTYTSEHLASFYELDTYFYSSFYTNNLFPEAVRFIQSYRRWFSKDMRNTYPKFGMLGFDIGYFFLKGISVHGNQLEEKLAQMQLQPIQTGFKFERVNNWGGFINRKVFFVHFSKDYELIKLDFE